MSKVCYVTADLADWGSMILAHSKRCFFETLVQNGKTQSSQQTFTRRMLNDFLGNLAFDGQLSGVLSHYVERRDLNENVRRALGFSEAYHRPPLSEALNDRDLPAYHSAGSRSHTRIDHTQVLRQAGSRDGEQVCVVRIAGCDRLNAIVIRQCYPRIA